MAKYLLRASYNAEGTRGLIKDGGVKRREAAEGLVKSLGGTMECFYYALGDDDAYVIVDVPDQASLVAASLAVGASGVVTASTTPLFTAEEMDEATKKAPSYKPPGS